MSRRTEPMGDSLELLLDTICNMFGGIVFISPPRHRHAADQRSAGVRASARTRRRPRSSRRRGSTPWRRTWSGLRLERDRLQAARTAQIELISRLIPDDYQRVLDRWRDAARERAEVEKEVAALESSNVDRVGKVTERARGSRRKPAGSPSRQRELAAAREGTAIDPGAAGGVAAAGGASAAACCGPGLPLLRPVLSAAPLWRGASRRAPISTTTLSRRRKTTPSTSIRSRPGGPWSTPVRWAEAEIRQVLRAFSPDEHQINVTVWPDSYDSFRRLRQILAASGFRYGILACEADSTVADRGGEQRPSQ